MGKLKVLGIIFGGVFFLFIVMGVLGIILFSNSLPEVSENLVEQQMKIVDSSTNLFGINCEFLGYQVDAYKDTLELSAMVGDKEGILEYVKLQKQYNENCT